MTNDDVASRVREEIPMFQSNPDMVYLDSAATSLKPQCVLTAMDDYYTKFGVNIHRGVYSLAHQATEAYDEARKTIAHALHAHQDEVIFTRGATDGLNMFASMASSFLEEGDEVITSILEHHSSLLPWMKLAREKGVKLVYLPLSHGRITKEGLEKALTPRTKVVALTALSNVMGYRTPLAELIPLAHAHGALVVIDAAQAYPHFPLDCATLGADALAFSLHKAFGPTGLGVLYLTRSLEKRLTPRDWGGDMIDEVHDDHATPKEAPYAFEAGTVPIAEIIGAGEAVRFLTETVGYDAIATQDEKNRHLLLDGLKEVPGITLYNPDSDIALASFNLTGIHPHDAATFYDQEGICLRAGHHCAQLVMRSLDVQGTLRASAYVYNTPDEIMKFLAVTRKAVAFFNDLEGGK